MSWRWTRAVERCDQQTWEVNRLGPGGAPWGPLTSITEYSKTISSSTQQPTLISSHIHLGPNRLCLDRQPNSIFLPQLAFWPIISDLSTSDLIQSWSIWYNYQLVKIRSELGCLSKRSHKEEKPDVSTHPCMRTHTHTLGYNWKCKIQGDWWVSFTFSFVVIVTHTETDFQP